MLYFLSKIWRKLFNKKYRLTLKTVTETMVKEYQFTILDNGHDYEVKVSKEGILVYHSVGFASKEDAESFVKFYQEQL